uniref:RNA-directed DNA polymerase n=1 Tax=Strongyloides stercoralis TaxID=6248 RepID=A0AAF5DLB4_STRER
FGEISSNHQAFWLDFVKKEIPSYFLSNVHAIDEIDDNKIRFHSEEVIPENAEWEDSLPHNPSRDTPLSRDDFDKLIYSTNLSKENEIFLRYILWKKKHAFHEYDDSHKTPRKIKPARISNEIEQEVSNQNQKWRFVVDFRHTNSLVKQQSHVISCIDKITSEAVRKTFYSSFDLKTGFHQIPLDKHSRQIAAFVTHEDKDEIHTNNEKVAALSNKPVLRTSKKLKSFLGAASYFRKHIKNYAAIASPLYSLDKNFKWEQKHTDAFELLKTALINAATLSPPDNTKNYTIFTDASFQGLGATLTQNGKPVAFVILLIKTSREKLPNN